MLSLSLHTNGSGRMVVVVMGGAPRVCLTIKMNYPRPHVITELCLTIGLLYVPSLNYHSTSWPGSSPQHLRGYKHTIGGWVSSQSTVGQGYNI